jgi:molybdopterin synthase catalytic subunit
MDFCETRITTETLHAPDERFSVNEGAVVDFWGVVRAIEDGRVILGIEYEAFEKMAERQLRLVAEEVKEQLQLATVVVHHRVGFVPVGEASLFVRVAARHRKAALEGCGQIVERLKCVVPIWKHPIDGKA